MPFLLVYSAAREEVWVHGNTNVDLDVQSDLIVSRGRGLQSDVETIRGHEALGNGA
jgi:hypothetical protein